MVEMFNLTGTPRVFFGAGQSKRLPEWLKNKGNRILFLTGAESFKKNNISELMGSLENPDIHIHHETVHGEPSPDFVDAITSKYRSAQIQIVTAIGGGSVLDTGKAVSAMLPGEGSVRDYLEGIGKKKHNGVKIFFVAVPTTAGTGSEATANAVISETGKNGFKRSIRHENLVPDLAIIDPAFTLHCSPEITANTGMDALTQLVESFVSTKANSFTDALALDGINKVHASLEQAVFDGDNLMARTGMAYAAFISGITLANAGLGLTHGFASSVGAFTEIPHGVVCGTLMGVVNKYNINALRDRRPETEAHQKYRQLGYLFSGAEKKSNTWYMDYCASWLEELADKLKIKRLGEFGILESDLQYIADNTDHKANPVEFDKKVLADILKERL